MKRGNRVEVGRITGEFGVKGWLKVHSYTCPKENILTYTPWFVCRGNAEVSKVCLEDSRWHGKNLLVKIEGIASREEATSYRGRQVTIPRDQLAATLPHECYLIDLIGLQVASIGGFAFGEVSDIIETGANEVLVVKGDRERLIPLIRNTYVINIDLEQKSILVDWDPEF